jgi:hypothetical protein
VKSCAGAEKKLVALSRSKIIGIATGEWRHDGLCQNLESPIAACDLCANNKLRFAFLIQNQTTHEKMWVGAGCLLRFQIPIYSGGVRVPAHRARDHLAELVQMLVTQEAMARCTMAAMEQQHSALAEAIIQYRMHGRVTVFEASLIFSAVEQANMLTSDVVLPIYLRREEDIEQLRAIPRWSLWRFWHCLKAEQVQLALLCGHKAPTTEHSKLVRYQRQTDTKPQEDCLGKMD